MYELVEHHERRAVGAAREMFGLAACIALVFALLTLSIFGGHEINQGNQPSDEELTANFFTHEATFDELAAMPVRPETYRSLLRQISVADLRYFPESGELILIPDGQENLQHPSKSYVYLPHAQPQSFAEHHIYYWRGPGVNIVTGDLPLKGDWFIRHDMTIAVAVTPY